MGAAVIPQTCLDECKKVIIQFFISLLVMSRTSIFEFILCSYNSNNGSAPVGSAPDSGDVLPHLMRVCCGDTDKYWTTFIFWFVRMRNTILASEGLKNMCLWSTGPICTWVTMARKNHNLCSRLPAVNLLKMYIQKLLTVNWRSQAWSRMLFPWLNSLYDQAPLSLAPFNNSIAAVN